MIDIAVGFAVFAAAITLGIILEAWERRQDRAGREEP